MTFWDSSALIVLAVDDPASEEVRDLRGPDRVVWWGTRVECASAVARLERERAVTPREAELIRGDLGRLLSEADEIQPGAAVRERAERLLRLHSLRAADALQLAAALVACRERPASLGFVCLDGRLRAGASAEGFEVLPP